MLWHASSIKQRLQAWAGQLKRDIQALWVAAGCSRTPTSAKVVAAFVAAYAFSPIDLIPDFIPVFGLLDDLILLPLGIALAVRLTPLELMVRYRSIAMRNIKREQSFWGVVVIGAFWALCLVLLVRFWYLHK
jgi:uncharacterized membrane protein YkvA (DUF1232 family)